jgi:hypothetical protein
MNDWVRLLVEHLLSWPVAVFGICLIFQSPLRALVSSLTSFISRANQLSLKHKDTAVEALADANLQVKKNPAESSEFGLGAGTAISVSKATVPEDLARERDALRDYGKGVTSVQVREESIREELNRLGFSLEDRETAEVLVRQLATLQCVTFFERTYRLIFGSQILAMDFLNTDGPVPATVVEVCFYETARNMEEEFYRDFTYDQWLSFMQDNFLIARDAENLAISIAGRDFLVWTVNSGLSHTKPH